MSARDSSELSFEAISCIRPAHSASPTKYCSAAGSALSRGPSGGNSCPGILYPGVAT
eukprot:CAMPEP_0183800862 /NCGR_PEP_ID=MMETSP0803_2-20130417/26173_1 /TAXON_ID=195967 /ORGANISM="Crustomastix stigmata, Strain CCMP3273" /LENGTH=56 /DNA_ID=CAMNT_0026045581 /DNA_START=528 /DNA_END=694 /DNA_ORIENTATION=-